MDRGIIKRGSELIEEIDELSKYKEFLKHNGCHFEFVNHYGNDSLVIQLPQHLTPKIIPILEKEIIDLEEQLEELQ